MRRTTLILLCEAALRCEARVTWILVIFLAALAVRVAAVIVLSGFGAPPVEWGDDPFFWRSASSLAEGHGYAQYGKPTAWMPPGYPLFLAAIQYFAGPNLAAVRWAQVILSAALVVLIMLLALRWFGWPAAVFAGAIACFVPDLAYPVTRLQKEGLYLLLLVAAVFAGAVAREKPSPARFAFCGALFGAAAITRSELLIAFPALLVWLAWVGGEKIRGWKRLHLCVLPFLAVLLIGPMLWGLRNVSAVGSFQIGTTGAGPTLFACNNPLMPVNEPQLQLVWEHPLVHKVSEVERDRMFRRLAFEWIKDHPRQFVRLSLLKFASLWDPRPHGQGPKRAGAQLSTLVTISSALLLTLFVIGLVITRNRWRDLFLVYVLLAQVSITGAVFFVGNERMRAPMVPFIIVLAGAVLVRGWLRLRRNEAEVRSSSSIDSSLKGHGNRL